MGGFTSKGIRIPGLIRGIGARSLTCGWDKIMVGEALPATASGRRLRATGTRVPCGRLTSAAVDIRRPIDRRSPRACAPVGVPFMFSGDAECD